MESKAIESPEATMARTQTSRLVKMADLVDAADILLEKASMDGGELRVDGGWSLP